MNIKTEPFPELKTDRLRLRSLLPTDADAIFLLRSDPNVNRYLDRKKAETIDDARSFIAMITDNIKANGVFFWALTTGNVDALLGTICLWNIDKATSTAEIGYEMLPSWQGRGYMQEAMSAIMNFGFSDCELKQLVAYTHRENLHSIKLLKKNGFTRDLRAEMKATDLPLEMVIYSLSSSKLEAQSSP